MAKEYMKSFIDNELSPNCPEGQDASLWAGKMEKLRLVSDSKADDDISKMGKKKSELKSPISRRNYRIIPCVFKFFRKKSAGVRLSRPTIP